MEEANVMDKRSKEEVARLIVTTLLVSDSSKYMSPNSQRQLSEMLVSKNPARDIRVAYKLVDSGDFSAEVGDLRIFWGAVGPEVIDEDGSVWTPTSLRYEISIGNCYRAPFAEFSKRADCIALIQDTAAKCIDILPGSLYEKTHSNDERLARDQATRRQHMTDILTKSIKVYDEGKLLKGHRQFGGKPRAVPPVLLTGIDPGMYVIVQSYGSRWSPKFKKFEVKVPDPKSGSRPYIVRIS